MIGSYQQVAAFQSFVLTARLTARSTSLNWSTRSSASDDRKRYINWFDPVIGVTADVNDDVNAQVTPSELRGS